VPAQGGLPPVPPPKPQGGAPQGVPPPLPPKLPPRQDIGPIGANQPGPKLSPKGRKPLVIFDSNVANAAMGVAAQTRRLKFKYSEIQLNIVLSDDNILKHVPDDLDDDYLANEIRKAASFETVIKELAALMIAVDNLPVNQAKTKFEEGMDKIIQDCLARAAAAIKAVAKIPSDYRNYLIKHAVSLTLSTAGAIVSVVGLAVTPFTGGVSTIAGIVGLVRTLSSIWVEGQGLLATVEEFILNLAKEIGTLQKQYLDAGGGEVSSTLVGLAEVGKTAAQSLVGPAIFKTIGQAKKDLEQANDKITGLKKKTAVLHQGIGPMTDGELKVRQELESFETSNAGNLTEEEVQKFNAVKTKAEEAQAAVTALINAIEKAHARVEFNQTGLQLLKAGLALVPAQPTWSVVGQILVKLTADVGLLVAGNVNVPDASESLKMAKEVTEDFARAIESLSAAKELGEGLNELIKKHRK
jgi:hypothetical protein